MIEFLGKRRNPLLIGLFLAFSVTPLFAGAGFSQETPEASYKARLEALPQEIFHPVAEGQDLHLLAAYYYGNARQWVKIFESNRDQIRDPNLIYPGQVLRVPVGKDWKEREPYQDWLKKFRPLTLPGGVPSTREVEKGKAPSKEGP